MFRSEHNKLTKRRYTVVEQKKDYNKANLINRIYEQLFGVRSKQKLNNCLVLCDFVCVCVGVFVSSVCYCVND